MEILGIHIDPPFIHTALIIKSRKGIEVSHLRAYPQTEDVKPLYIPKHKGKIVTGLSPRHFLIRQIAVKAGKSRHVEEAISFQSEATSHFSSSEMLTVPLLQKNDKGTTEALLFIVQREALKEHLFNYQKLNIDPDIVSTTPLALFHFTRWKFPDLQEGFLISIGSHEMSCTLMENGELKKAHVIQMGVEDLLLAHLEDRKKILLKKEVEGSAKQVDLLHLKPGLNPHLNHILSEMKQEFAKTLISFCRESKKEVVVTGRVDAFIHLKEALLDGEAFRILTPDEEKYAISIGLALEQTTQKGLQLRREEFFPQKNWHRMGFYALSLITFSILLSALLLSLGAYATRSRKVAMLHSFGISTEGNVEEKIDEWIGSIEKTNKEYPYILQSPKVAEVLAWISSHPLLEELKMEGDPIELKEIRYQLVSAPRVGSTKDPYLTKVEIEFQFQNAMNARKFHEALRQGDAMVTPDLEMSWDSLSDGYRASFFLQNRGRDVP